MVTALGIDGELTAANLLEEVGIVLAYCGVGLVMLVLGFLLVDLLVPGRLRDLIWGERNYNAAVLVTTGFVAQGLIVIAAIWASAGDLGEGLITTVAYSIVGLIVSTVVFFIVDLFTPSSLRRDLVHAEPHPGSWVVGILRIVVSGIIALAIL